MPGELVHFELPAGDTTRARAFSSDVFGWAFADAGLAGFECWMTKACGGRAEEKRPIPEIGRFARSVDTEGNELSLFESDASVGA